MLPKYFALANQYIVDNLARIDLPGGVIYRPRVFPPVMSPLSTQFFIGGHFDLGKSNTDFSFDLYKNLTFAPHETSDLAILVSPWLVRLGIYYVLDQIQYITDMYESIIKKFINFS
jgi:hypothetical protein